MPQSYAALYCHLVFSTRNRTPWIGPEVEERLYSYLGGLVRGAKGTLLAAGGMPDHVHLLIAVPRDLSVAELVRHVKANSSGWVHETFPTLRDFAWQGGYGAFSVGHSGLENVAAYIRNQKEHHRSQSFQDEYRGFLTRYGIEFDERYLWSEE